VKIDAHGSFTPEMMKRSQATWIETFVEGVTDKSTGLPIFKELVWFKLHQKLVEKLVCAHTNLVLRESLDDPLHHLLPWDIELIIDEPVDESEEEPED
jgi:hypothetical protein